MSKTKRKHDKTISTTIIASLSYIILGLVMVFYPSKVSLGLCYAIGGALTVYGLFNLISFFINRALAFGFELIIGVAATAFGVYFLLSPQAIQNIVAVILGILVIVDSMIDVKRSFQLKTYGVKKWWISFLLSLLVIILAICTILFPTIFASAIMIILGIALIYEGVSALALIGIISHFSKKVIIKTDNRIIEVDATDVD